MYPHLDMLAPVLTYALVALGSVGYDYGIRSASRSAIDNALSSSTERNAAIIYAAWALATSASVFAVVGYVSIYLDMYLDHPELDHPELDQRLDQLSQLGMELAMLFSLTLLLKRMLFLPLQVDPGKLN